MVKKRAHISGIGGQLFMRDVEGCKGSRARRARGCVPYGVSRDRRISKAEEIPTHLTQNHQRVHDAGVYSGRALGVEIPGRRAKLVTREFCLRAVSAADAFLVIKAPEILSRSPAMESSELETPEQR